MNFNEPTIDYAGISPVIALTVGLCVVLLSAVFKPVKRWAPGLTLLTLASTAGLLIRSATWRPPVPAPVSGSAPGSCAPSPFVAGGSEAGNDSSLASSLPVCWRSSSGAPTMS